MQLLLLCFWVHWLYCFKGLGLHIVLNCLGPVWHVALHWLVSFHLSYDQNTWEHLGVLEAGRPKLNLPLVYHHDSLLVVICHLKFNNLVIRVTNNSNDKVHENHKQEENTHCPNEESEVDDVDWVPVDIWLPILVLHVYHIKCLIRVNQAEVSHCTS
mgnify:CR=1 FL=1